MRQSNRTPEQIELVESYCKSNMLWRTGNETISYTDVVTLDLSTVVPTVSGPKRPQDKILLKDFKQIFIKHLKESYDRNYIALNESVIDKWRGEGGSQPIHTNNQDNLNTVEVQLENGMKKVWVSLGEEKFMLNDGAVVIAAITSCTNTSNPYVMIGAGLVARKARLLGIDVKPWVKTSLAPGSKVVTDYLKKADLLGDLEALQFHVVGYGCTSCIGNSGPLPYHIAKAVEENDIVVASVLSGNRNFEARIHPQVKMNFLMSPMLVVVYALAGRVDVDIMNEPISYDRNQQPIYLKDIWPTNDEIQSIMQKVLSPADFEKNYKTIFDGNSIWQQLSVAKENVYTWSNQSTYIKQAPFFQYMPNTPLPLQDIENARVLLMLGDSITTDHISPAGSFSEHSAAGKYLLSKGVSISNFNSYGSRRGNDEVMVRGTFANVRIKNKIATKEGGYTIYLPTGEEMFVYDAAMRYKENSIPLIVLAGKEYGSGSSRDWAAKGTFLLGIKAVLAESYERIHRSNLVGMGVLPLQYQPGENAVSLGLSGKEFFNIMGIDNQLSPLKILSITAKKEDGTVIQFNALARLDSQIEVEYFKNGGILQYVLRQFLKQ
jgi:aconitate hydratase